MTRISLFTSSTVRDSIARYSGAYVDYYYMVLVVPYLTWQMSLALAATVLEGKPLYRNPPFG